MMTNLQSLVTNELKLRLDDIDRKISANDKKLEDQYKRFDDQGKRIDDVKWAIDKIMTVFGLIFTIVVLFAGVNYAVDRGRLESFEKDIKERLSKTDDTQLVLLGENGSSIFGQDVNASILQQGVSQNIRNQNVRDKYISFTLP
jgi:hypothetical protein